MRLRLQRLGRAAVWPVLAAAALAVPLTASAPPFWTVSTQTDFLKNSAARVVTRSASGVDLGEMRLLGYPFHHCHAGFGGIPMGPGSGAHAKMDLSLVVTLYKQKKEADRPVRAPFNNRPCKTA